MALFGGGGPQTCCPAHCDGNLRRGGTLSRRGFLGRAKLAGALGLAGTVYAVHATDGKILVPVVEWLAELPKAAAAEVKAKAGVRPKPKASTKPVSKAGAVELRTSASAKALLDNRRLELAGRAAADLRAGIVDERLIRLLTLLLGRYRLSVGIFETGHRRCVAGTGPGTGRRCHVSQHIGGYACDIGAVNGRPVTAGSRAARELVAFLARLEGDLRPTEVGSPFPAYAPLPGFFSDEDHTGHVHLGVKR